MNKERLWGRSFISICMSVLFMFLINYALVSTLPFYVVTKYHADITQVGLIVTAFAIAALVSRPLAGPFMKRFGERNAFLTAAVLYFAASSLFLVAGSLQFLLALRLVQGFAAGVGTSSGGTIAARLVPKTRAGEGMGYYAVVMSLAMIIGPYVGLTLIQSMPFTVLFASCAVFSMLSVVGGLLVQVAVPETQAQAAAATNARPWTGLRTLLEAAASPVLCAVFWSLLPIAGPPPLHPSTARGLG